MPMEQLSLNKLHEIFAQIKKEISLRHALDLLLVIEESRKIQKIPAV